MGDQSLPHPHFVFLAAIVENERLHREIESISARAEREIEEAHAHAHQERVRCYRTEAKIQPMFELVHRYGSALQEISHSGGSRQAEMAAIALGDLHRAAHIRGAVNRAYEAMATTQSAPSKAALPAWKRILLKLIGVEL